MVLGEEAVADMIKGKEIAKDNSTSTTVQAEEISKSTIDLDDEKKLSVLIVDDSALTRLLHSITVTKLGLEAHFAENGKEAVDLHQSGASFDLILMDMEMPVMDGVQATKELRAMGVDTIIVGVTASERQEQQVFLEAGLNDCYSKPLPEGKLAALVQDMKETKEKGI